MIAYMQDKKSREKLSRIRQKIFHLRKLQGAFLDKLLRPKPMVIGSLYEVYKTCGKPNCCCERGIKHGPFPALSISLAGKRRVKMVRKGDLPVVREKALAYQSFQQGLASIRKLNKEIDALLEQIKKEFLEEYR
jgi:Family of unknown function (DUF6788)